MTGPDSECSRRSVHAHRGVDNQVSTIQMPEIIVAIAETAMKRYSRDLRIVSPIIRLRRSRSPPDPYPQSRVRICADCGPARRQVFMGDLMRKIELPWTNIDFMAVSELWRRCEVPHRVSLRTWISTSAGRDVPIVEDTGLGPDARAHLMKNLESRVLPCWRLPPSRGRTLRTVPRPSRPSMLEPIAPMPL